jgi:uncharacterized protein (DUF2237 family)
MELFVSLTLVLLSLLSFVNGSNHHHHHHYKNVFGHSLSSCSSEGMALTGVTRTGYCVDEDDDAGSHHICIDLSSTKGGNFCTVTNQTDPNWCVGKDACNNNKHEKCGIKNWCVCQWAFSTYIDKAGGCDAIQDLVCDAVNMEALLKYREKAPHDRKIKNALDCLVKRCHIDTSSDSTSQSGRAQARGNRGYRHGRSNHMQSLYSHHHR